MKIFDIFTSFFITNLHLMYYDSIKKVKLLLQKLDINLHIFTLNYGQIVKDLYIIDVKELFCTTINFFFVFVFIYEPINTQ